MWPNRDYCFYLRYAKYLKSYGKNWAGSQLEILVEGKKADAKDSRWETLHDAYLSGEQTTTTSINYSHHVDLGGFFQPGSSIRATFTVVGGNIFQINGLSLCYNAQALDDV